MSQPPGFVNPSFLDHVCKLNKAIYGQKWASRAWYDELHHYLLSQGFMPTISYPSLFHFPSPNFPIFLIVYVDDIIITGPNLIDKNNIITSLASRLSLKDLGQLSYFFGIEVMPYTQRLILSQSKYIHDILQRTEMLESKLVLTPMSTNPHYF